MDADIRRWEAGGRQGVARGAALKKREQERASDRRTVGGPKAGLAAIGLGVGIFPTPGEERITPRSGVKAGFWACKPRAGGILEMEGFVPRKKNEEERMPFNRKNSDSPNPWATGFRRVRRRKFASQL